MAHAGNGHVGDGEVRVTAPAASGLRDGITMAAARMLSGTPLATGSGTATVTARDSDGDTATLSFGWKVKSPDGDGTGTCHCRSNTPHFC